MENKFCYISNKILKDNKNIGFFYREEPDFEGDTGWCFLAGDEDEDYMENPENISICKISEVIELDKRIIEYLDSEVGSAFEFK